MRRLVVLVGPIGSGKSTVAGILGHRLVAGGLTAAIADLDDVAFAHRGPLDLAEFWRRAGVAHLALVRGWFDAGVDTVIAHGPFFESGTYDELFEAVGTDGLVWHVLLRVDVEVAYERVGHDPDRAPDAISKDSSFLRSTHEVFRQLEPGLPSADLIVDTSVLSADQVADRIEALLG